MKWTNLKRGFATAAVLTAVITLTGCKEPQETPIKGTLQAYADESLTNLIKTESRNFTSVYKDSRINIIPLQARDGITRILNGEIKFFLSSRDLNTEENNFALAGKSGIRKFKFCYDAISVVTSKKTAIDKIRVPELVKILEGIDKNYTIVIPPVNSGTYEYVKSVLLNGKNPQNYETVDSEFKVTEAVKNRMNVIGLAGLNTITDTKEIKILKVGTALISNEGDSFYEPLAGYLINGDYPLTRISYIFLNETGLGLASGFTTFLTSYDGQIILPESNLGPAAVPVRLKQSN